MTRLGVDSRDPAFLLHLWRTMVRVRLIEEAIAARYHSDGEMRCPVHLSIGQEAVSAGVCAVLEPTDKIVTTHRSHAHYLAKGGDLSRMLAELMGRADGCCGGRGGSMHLFDHDAGVLLSLPIVSSSIPVGVGAALAFRQRREDGVVAIFMGDASVEEGVFHESANLAAKHRLPAIFVCENNLYSVYTRLDARQPDRPITEIARAHAIPARRVDGNDVLAVLKATVEAVDHARLGHGPSFLQFDTYRWLEHCGPNFDNDQGYRTELEFAEWRQRCPVESFTAELTAQGILSQATQDDIMREIGGEIDTALAAAIEAPLPDSNSASEHVYA